MRHLLDFVYLLVLVVLSPWLIYKTLTTGKYRRGSWAKLSGRALLREASKPCVWFHGVSVGEIHLLRQVVTAFRRRHPEWDVVISTTTDTGYDEAEKRFPDLPVFFWPLDFSWAVGRGLRRVRPSLVVLAEGEVWPNFVASAKRQAIPVAVINGRVSPRSFRRYRRLRWLGGPWRQLDLIVAQNQEYADHYRALGVRPERLVVTGSVKYDGVSTNRDNPRTRELGRLLGVRRPEELVLMAGSTQAPEEEILLKIYRAARAQHRDLRLVIVPRQKERFDEVAGFLTRSGEPFVRRSQLARPLTHSPSHPVTLVDSIGELGALWGLADVAFVGGSLDGRRGGQNMIEPAAYGAAVVFGPHTWNFKETVTRLLEQHAALELQDATALEREIVRLLGDPAARQALGAAAQRFVLAQQGATERTLDTLDGLLSAAYPHRSAA